MYHLIIAGIGGFIGTVMRYLLNNLIYSLLSYPLFPYGTFIINVLGCFFIGLLAALIETRLTITPEIRIFIQIGILGGFTTFSTYAYETFTLLRDGQLMMGLGNLLLQVVLGLIAVYIGYSIGQIHT